MSEVKDSKAEKGPLLDTKGTTIIVPVQEQKPLKEQFKKRFEDLVMELMPLDPAVQDSEPVAREIHERTLAVLDESIKAIELVQTQNAALEEKHTLRENLSERLRHMMFGVNNDLEQKHFAKVEAFLRGFFGAWMEIVIDEKSWPQKTARAMDFSLILWCLHRVKKEMRTRDVGKLTDEEKEKREGLFTVAKEVNNEVKQLGVAKMMGVTEGGMSYCIVQVGDEHLDLFPVGLFPGHQKTKHLDALVKSTSSVAGKRKESSNH